MLNPDEKRIKHNDVGGIIRLVNPSNQVAEKLLSQLLKQKFLLMIIYICTGYSE